MVAEGDKVVVHFTFRGTHKGVFAGIPPTGKQVEMKGVQIARLVNEQIVEDWVIRDTMGLMQQLGVIPPRPKPSKYACARIHALMSTLAHPEASVFLPIYL
jgi:hypothetical protein